MKKLINSLLNYKDSGRLQSVYVQSLLRYSTPKKILNALRTEYAYRRRLAYVPSAPYILFLEPLYYCNLHCPLCDRQIFSEARKRDAGYLSLDLYDQILDEISDYLFQCQIFGQGEPLLDWELTKEIVQRTHHRRIFTLLSTNCTLMTPEIARDIVSSGLDHLVCAIDGITQDSYSKYRMGGKVEDALAGLRLIVEERRRQNSSLFIEWQFLVNAFNVAEIEQARSLAEQLGVTIRFAPLRGMEYDTQLQAYWLPNTSAWQEGRKAPGETCYNWPCYFLWRSLVLNSNGNIARCLIYQNVSEYGSPHTQSALSLYNHSSVQRARQLFQKRNVPDGDFPSPCNNCSFFAREHGGPNLDKLQSLSSLSTLPNTVPNSDSSS
ncbi:MAG TPA: radical SAM protein [Phormidium sp.]